MAWIAHAVAEVSDQRTEQTGKNLPGVQLSQASV